MLDRHVTDPLFALPTQAGAFIAYDAVGRFGECSERFVLELEVRCDFTEVLLGELARCERATPGALWNGAATWPSDRIRPEGSRWTSTLGVSSSVTRRLRTRCYSLTRTVTRYDRWKEVCVSGDVPVAIT